MLRKFIALLCALALSAPILGIALAFKGMDDWSNKRLIPAPVPAANKLLSTSGIFERSLIISTGSGVRSTVNSQYYIGIIKRPDNSLFPFSCKAYGEDMLYCMYVDSWVEDRAVDKWGSISYYQYPNRFYGENDVYGKRDDQTFEGQPMNIAMEAYYMDGGQRHYLLRYADSYKRMTERPSVAWLGYAIAAILALAWPFAVFKIFQALSYRSPKPPKRSAPMVLEG